MPDFDALSIDAQGAALARLAGVAAQSWDLGGQPEITLLKCRENAVFRIDAADTTLVMRVHRAGYHSADALESELQWMTELRRSGIATPEVVPNSRGRLFELVACDEVPEPRLVDVLSWVAGEPLGSLEEGIAAGDGTRKSFFETGRLMARLHNHAQSWQRPKDFTRHAWDVEGLLGDRPLWGRFWELDALDAGQRDVVLAAREQAAAELAEFGTGDDRYGLIHADFLPENLLVADGTIALIDFDDAGFGWHLFDIATSLFVVADSPDFDGILGAFTSGYRAERHLPDEHLARLPLFFLLRGLTYLGWLHTRSETETAQQLTPEMVAAVSGLATEYLATTPATTPSAIREKTPWVSTRGPAPGI
ncbi:phosphotransferase enzyme family protein [Gordonia sp. SL306]|uniref:phosphotransferase enzyme family protein n=1 Tax=Gordonia sp. SL306 TaxID=2995145 RepID=UPI002270FB2E|nr:phosphotransferase [Gordonia sp. SL306]WAC57731.1 phosphotransferase [Gordonia sp. SL306]